MSTKAHKILIEYDLERRVGNVIPIGGGEPLTTPVFNDLPADVINNVVISAAVGATKLSVASIPIRQVTIYSDLANVGNVLVGNVNPTFPIVPGGAMTIVIDNISKIYFNTAVANIIYYLAERF